MLMIDPADRFLQPSSSRQRRYEALRARFVDGCSSAEAASRFGYAPGSFRNLGGLFLFAGLNAIPKRSTLTEYSCRCDPRLLDPLTQRWHDALRALDSPLGSQWHSFNGQTAFV